MKKHFLEFKIMIFFIFGFIQVHANGKELISHKMGLEDLKSIHNARSIILSNLSPHWDFKKSFKQAQLSLGEDELSRTASEEKRKYFFSDLLKVFKLDSDTRSQILLHKDLNRLEIADFAAYLLLENQLLPSDLTNEILQKLKLGYNAMYEALEGNHYYLTKYLINQNPKYESIQSGLEVAASKGHIDIVHLVLDKYKLHDLFESVVKCASTSSRNTFIQLLNHKKAFIFGGISLSELNKWLETYAEKDFSETVDALFNYYPSYEGVNDALEASSAKGNLETVDRILERYNLDNLIKVSITVAARNSQKDLLHHLLMKYKSIYTPQNLKFLQFLLLEAYVLKRFGIYNEILRNF